MPTIGRLKIFFNYSSRHCEWRKLAKKSRRKRIRQSIAKSRYEVEEAERRRREQSPTYQEFLKKQEEEERFEAEEEAQLTAEAEQRWRQIEAEAQRQWQELQKKLAAAREEKAKQIARIKLEWEKEQQRLKELQEQKEREREEKEQQQRLIREQIENFIENGGATPEYLKNDYEMNPGKPICPFFEKTGACRFRDNCSRNHIKPGISRCLLITNFYQHYSLEQMANEYGTDASLEYENDETYRHFKEFFYDVLPEMERFGRVQQFKVCCNHEPHLRGNVYVEYSTTREAVKSYQVFNGRWYGGKQLNVEFCNIKSWKSAICGLHFKKTCPKGNACNFLHVFKNPQNLFSRADKDEHRTPEINIEQEERNWRWSESPERVPFKNQERIDNESPRSRQRSRSRSRTKKRKHRRKSRSRSRKSSHKRRRH